MEDRILSGTVFVMLSVTFAGHGIWTLCAAYRAADANAWAEKAVQGSFGIIVGAVFADVVSTLFS